MSSRKDRETVRNRSSTVLTANYAGPEGVYKTQLMCYVLHLKVCMCVFDLGRYFSNLSIVTLFACMIHLPVSLFSRPTLCHFL